METEFKTIKQEVGVEAHETLKLEKNSKGYNWEVKIFMDMGSDMDSIERLEFINSKLFEKFGNNNGSNIG